MFGARFLTSLLMGGLAASPVAALYCSEGDAAAMACCREDMSQCNQPGKTDDCCRTSPDESREHGALPALKADLKAPTLNALAVLPLGPELAQRPGIVALGRVQQDVSTGRASPPRSPILRV